MRFSGNDFFLYTSAVFCGIYYGSKYFSVCIHVKHCSCIHLGPSIPYIYILIYSSIFISNFREISCSLYYFWESNVSQIEFYFNYVMIGVSLFLYTAIWIRLKNRSNCSNSEGKTIVHLPTSHSL